MDSTGEILSWWTCHESVTTHWSEIKFPLLCAPQHPETIIFFHLCLPQLVGEECYRGLVESHHAWLRGLLAGSGRVRREPLLPQHTDIQDGALVPGMCERTVTTEFSPCMRLRSTLSQDTLSTGSNFL